jgi:hypothetical protein
MITSDNQTIDDKYLIITDNIGAKLEPWLQHKYIVLLMHEKPVFWPAPQ